MSLTKRINAIIDTGDMIAWKTFLDGTTMQDACYAHLLAVRAGNKDMHTLAAKRTEHLNGEHRHPEWC